MALLASLAAGPSWPAPAGPLIDNERVSVWDRQLPASTERERVAITLGVEPAVQFLRRGQAAAASETHDVTVELKELAVPALANHSGYPLAFPRPHARKLFENDRVIVWSYRWQPGEPSPMHFHDKDVVVVFDEQTALRSTTPDGKSVVNHYRAGEIRFNRRDRTHTELLASPSGSAVITELK